MGGRGGNGGCGIGGSVSPSSVAFYSFCLGKDVMCSRQIKKFLKKSGGSGPTGPPILGLP